MSEDLDSDPPRPPFLYPFDRASVTLLHGQDLYEWLERVAPAPKYVKRERIKYPRQRKETRWQR